MLDDMERKLQAANQKQQMLKDTIVDKNNYIDDLLNQLANLQNRVNRLENNNDILKRELDRAGDGQSDLDYLKDQLEREKFNRDKDKAGNDAIADANRKKDYIIQDLQAQLDRLKGKEDDLKKQLKKKEDQDRAARDKD